MSRLITHLTVLVEDRAHRAVPFKGPDAFEKAHDFAIEQEKAGFRTRILREVEIKCDCGNVIDGRAFTNTCDRCGADYNNAGQRLAPRSQWGEETGEHWTDCY